MGGRGSAGGGNGASSGGPGVGMFGREAPLKVEKCKGRYLPQQAEGLLFRGILSFADCAADERRAFLK